MTSDKMTCRELVELITDYLEGVLPKSEHLRFEEHLAGCTGCRNYLDQMRWTIAILGRLTEDNLISVAHDELLELFRDWKAA